MTNEDLKAIAQEEINKAITENLDSAIIFKYISNLENKIEKQQAEIDKYKEIYAVSIADRVNSAFKQEHENNEDLEMLYKGCQIELEKKDKIIDLMAEQIKKDTDWFYGEFDNYTIEEIKECFKKKVEENK